MGRTLRNSKKNPHAGEIGVGESDVRLLKRNKAKYSHAGEIGEGESDMRCWNQREEWECTVQRVQPDSGSPLWKEVTVAMTALVYSYIHVYIGGMYTDWCTVPASTQVNTEASKTDLPKMNILRSSDESLFPRNWYSRFFLPKIFLYWGYWKFNCTTVGKFIKLK